MTRTTDKLSCASQPEEMDHWVELQLALGLVALLAAVGLRWGPSNAIEGIYLTLVLIGLRSTRLAARAFRLLIRLIVGR